MEVDFDGKPVHRVQDLVRNCCSGNPDSADLAWRFSTVNGEILRPGEQKDFLSIRVTEDATLWKRVNEATKKVEVKVCYCSVFDECWVTRSSTNNKAERVQACPADWAQYGD